MKLWTSVIVTAMLAGACSGGGSDDADSPPTLPEGSDVPVSDEVVTETPTTQDPTASAPAANLPQTPAAQPAGGCNSAGDGGVPMGALVVLGLAGWALARRRRASG